MTSLRKHLPFSTLPMAVVIALVATGCKDGGSPEAGSATDGTDATSSAGTDASSGSPQESGAGSTSGSGSGTRGGSSSTAGSGGSGGSTSRGTTGSGGSGSTSGAGDTDGTDGTTGAAPAPECDALTIQPCFNTVGCLWTPRQGASDFRDGTCGAGTCDEIDNGQQCASQAGCRPTQTGCENEPPPPECGTVKAERECDQTRGCFWSNSRSQCLSADQPPPPAKCADIDIRGENDLQAIGACVQNGCMVSQTPNGPRCADPA